MTTMTFERAPDTRATTPQAADAPPPGLDWRLALLLGIVSFGIVLVILAFWQSSWARKVNRASRARLYYVGHLVFAVLYGVFSADPSTAAAGLLFYVAAVVLFQCGNFSVKNVIESHFYDSPERVQLSGLMTFFFGTIYFQYHFTQIRARRRALAAAA